jgi:hypothetical protein
MKISRRISLLAFVGGLIVFLGILFSTYWLENIVFPIATVLLLLRRVVESVDQVLYWGLLISGFLFYVMIRLVQVEVPGEDPSPGPRNVLLDEIKNWRFSILFAGEDSRVSLRLKQDLEKMIAGVFAVDQPSTAPLSLREALRKRELPLPEHLYRFLFQDDAQKAGRSFRQRVRQVFAAPGKWIRRFTGREKADTYRSLKEILTFLEEWMEIKNGDEYFDAPDH